MHAQEYIYTNFPTKIVQETPGYCPDEIQLSQKNHYFHIVLNIFLISNHFNKIPW